jgi:hypothetical protein
MKIDTNKEKSKKLLEILTLESIIDSSTRKEFWKNMSYIRNILFSFIFGFGLTRLDNALSINFSILNVYKLLIAYTYFFIDWVGYNWVVFVIREYTKQNFLVYFIDYVATFIYWGLLYSYNLALIYSLYLYMFLYFQFTIWALVRYILDKSKFGKRRIFLNLAFLVIFALNVVIYQWVYQANDYLLCSIILVLQILFRTIKAFPFFRNPMIQ